MINELRVFGNDDFSEVRIKEIDGEPWFVAADVCRVLELSDVSMSLKRLDEDEKDTSLICTPGGTQEMSIINESGLYSLVLSSRKPEARAFKRWITHEVIPSIRKTGSYGVSQELIDEITFLKNQITELQNKQNFIEECLQIPTHEISEWQTEIYKKLELVLEYYRGIPCRGSMTMEMLIKEIKLSLFTHFGLSFDESKDFYLMRYPHTKPTDFEVIEDTREYKIGFEKMVDALLLKKAEHDARMAELKKYE